MSAGSRSVGEAFAAIVDALGDRPGVERPGGPGQSRTSARRFGADALRINGRIFAMVTRGGLVLKLPAPRVAELVGSGDGATFGAGKGRPMKEWVSLAPGRSPRWPDEWLALAAEALAWARAGH